MTAGFQDGNGIDGRNAVPRPHGIAWLAASPFFRLLAINWLIGAFVAAMVLGGLLWFDTGGLRSLVLASDQPWLPVLLLFAGLILPLTIRCNTELADALREEGLVTVEMLTTALREGEVPLFVALFAQVSKLREHLIQRLVFETGGEGLAIACRGIGMSEQEFMELYEYCHLAKAGTKEEVEAHKPKLSSFFTNTPRKSAVDVLKMWHRGSDYLGALRELEMRLKDHG